MARSSGNTHYLFNNNTEGKLVLKKRNQFGIDGILPFFPSMH
jgi:hypothetical protein